MRTVRHRLAAVAGVTCLLLASGCGGNPEPKPLPKSDPKPSPSPTASPSATPPVLPAAAKAKTRTGAIAFVRHYVALVNYAGATGETSLLSSASLATCVKCAALTDGISKIYAGGGKIQGGGWQVVGTKTYGFDDGHFFLDATIDSAPQVLIKRDGAKPQQLPGAKNRLRAFVLERKGDDWRVSELDPTA